MRAARRRRSCLGGGGRRRVASSRPGHALWSAFRRGPARRRRRGPPVVVGFCLACADIKSEFEEASPRHRRGPPVAFHAVSRVQRTVVPSFCAASAVSRISSSAVRLAAPAPAPCSSSSHGCRRIQGSLKNAFARRARRAMASSALFLSPSSSLATRRGRMIRTAPQSCNKYAGLRSPASRTMFASTCVEINQ